jgi:hypothetical protein
MVNFALFFIPSTPPFEMAPRAWNQFNHISHEGKVPF